MKTFEPSQKSLQSAFCAIGSFFVPILALAFVGSFGALLLSGNFRVVVPDELYRSAQPDAADLGNYAKRFGIETIINLRGENTGSSWYDAEVAKAAQLGIAHVDFRMSAGRELTQEEAAKLIRIFRTARKPMLIHCQNGADRTGLAAALYLAAVTKRDEEAAEAQMSIRFGHFSLPMTRAYAMDQTFETLEPWLGYPSH